MANYRRELRIGIDLRKKEKIKKATEFMKRIRKMQKKMKRQPNRERKEAEEQKVRDRVILNTKDLAFKKRLASKLVDQYIGLYTIDEMISVNAVKLQLPNLMRIYLVVNVSWVVQYKN